MPSSAKQAEASTGQATVAHIVDALLAIYNGKDDRGSAEHFAPDYVQGAGIMQDGWHGLRLEAFELRTALPDLVVTPEHQMVEGDRLLLVLNAAGTHTGQLLGRAFLSGSPSGRATRFSITSLFAMSEGRLARRLFHQVDLIGAEQVLEIPVATAWPSRLRDVEVLHTFAPGSFIEGVTIGGEGRPYMTSELDGVVYRYDPVDKITEVARLPLSKGEKLMCLAFDRPDHFFVGLRSSDPERVGVWGCTVGGDLTRVAPLPWGTYPNGLTCDAAGRVFVADSVAATVWMLDPRTLTVEPWFRSELIGRRPLVGMVHGTNGLQIAHNTLYATNSDRGTLVTVPIKPDGSAGEPSVTDGIVADDFAVGASGRVYYTTHPYNSLVAHDFETGTASVLATAAESMVGPTAAAFGQAADDRHSLYVVTDGGIFAPVPGHPMAGQLLRLQIDDDEGVPPAWWRI
jgi:predicted ester cyclase/sugar lactone lactonase YvrE